MRQQRKEEGQTKETAPNNLKNMCSKWKIQVAEKIIMEWKDDIKKTESKSCEPP